MGFRQRFGEHAGWGHQLLFAAELQEFRDLLPPSMLLQMEEARILEKAIKAREKEEKAARKAAGGPVSASASPASASASASGAKSKSKPKRSNGNGAGVQSKRRRLLDTSDVHDDLDS